MNKFLVLLLFLGLNSFAQTSYSVLNSANQKGATTSQLSVGNIWFSSKVSYNLTENKIDDNFALTGRVLYTPILSEKYAVPIVLTASTDNGSLLSTESGVNVGVYPFYKLVNTATTAFLIHGGVGYKELLKNAPEPIKQVRALAAVEVSFFQKEGGVPVTISAGPIYTHSASIGGKTSLEITGVLPIAKNLGTLIEWNSGTGNPQAFKIGVIINTNVK